MIYFLFTMSNSEQGRVLPENFGRKPRRGRRILAIGGVILVAGGGVATAAAMTDNLPSHIPYLSDHKQPADSRLEITGHSPRASTPQTSNERTRPPHTTTSTTSETTPAQSRRTTSNRTTTPEAQSTTAAGRKSDTSSQPETSASGTTSGPKRESRAQSTKTGTTTTPDTTPAPEPAPDPTPYKLQMDQILAARGVRHPEKMTILADTLYSARLAGADTSVVNLLAQKDMYGEALDFTKLPASTAYQVRHAFTKHVRYFTDITKEVFALPPEAQPYLHDGTIVVEEGGRISVAVRDNAEFQKRHGKDWNYRAGLINKYDTRDMKKVLEGGTIKYIIAPLKVEEAPTPWVKHIYVNLTTQHLAAYVENNLERKRRFYMPLSSGSPYTRTRSGETKPTQTRKGDFKIELWYKHYRMKSSREAEKAGIPRYDKLVKFAVFFDLQEGNAFHAAPWNKQIGKRPMSHGCLNMTGKDAEKLFYWTYPIHDKNKIKKIGMRSPVHDTASRPDVLVTVYGRTPK